MCTLCEIKYALTSFRRWSENDFGSKHTALGRVLGRGVGYNL